MTLPKFSEWIVVKEASDNMGGKEGQGFRSRKGSATIGSPPPAATPAPQAVPQAATPTAAPQAAPASTEAPAPDPNTMSVGKRGRLNTEARKAVNDWIDTKVLLPANAKATPEQIVGNRAFKALVAALPQKDRDTVAQEAIRSITEKRKAKFTTDNHAAADDAFAKKAAAQQQPTSAPTATPAAQPAPAKKGGFGSWMKNKLGMG